MKVIKFAASEGRLVLKADNVEDLWAIERIIFPGDIVKAKTLRKFRAYEGDKGELKKVILAISVEKVDFDKNAQILRISGKIIDGKPIEFVRLNSYHTLNIEAKHMLEIRKGEWPDYLIQVIRNAVANSKRPRLGIIALDEEKALPAQLLGYGIQFLNEIYSHTSKRLSKKDFDEAQKRYFDEILQQISMMDVDTVIIAGPGFTKDDFSAYVKNLPESSKPKKALVYMKTSNTERSGIYELIKSDEVSQLLKGESIRKEFMLIGKFLEGLAAKTSKYGIENVSNAISDYEASIIIVNDSMLSDDNVRELLKRAEAMALKIEIINSNDEAGQQLSSFGGIACF